MLTFPPLKGQLALKLLNSWISILLLMNDDHREETVLNEINSIQIFNHPLSSRIFHDMMVEEK
jgi:hypothetical protein